MEAPHGPRTIVCTSACCEKAPRGPRNVVADQHLGVDATHEIHTRVEQVQLRLHRDERRRECQARLGLANEKHATPVRVERVAARLGLLLECIHHGKECIPDWVWRPVALGVGCAESVCLWQEERSRTHQ